MSKAEDLLELHLKADKTPGFGYVREFEAIPGRKFRYDFYCAIGKRGAITSARSVEWDIKKVLVEVQGGVWLKGKSGHSSGTGITRDCEKLSLAAVHGYRCIVVTPAQIKSGQAINWIKQALA